MVLLRFSLHRKMGGVPAFLGVPLFGPGCLDTFKKALPPHDIIPKGPRTPWAIWALLCRPLLLS